MSQTGFRLSLVGLSLAILIFATGCIFDSAPKSKPVLVVNSKELSLEDFSQELAQQMRQFDAIGAKDPNNIKATKEGILDRFLQDALVETWAEKSKVSITDDDLDREIDSLRKQYPDDLSMKEALRVDGITFDTWKLRTKKTLLQKKVFETLKASMPTPSVEELKSFYTSNKELFEIKPAIRLRQIVLEKADAAERLLEQIKKNTDLAPLAKQFSIAPEASNGGDTGWIPKGTLDIFDKAFDWPVGKRSGVLKSPYGFHIFEVIGKRGESQLKFEDAQDRIIKLIQADREQAVFSAWLEEQIKAAHVLRDDDLINAVSVVTKGEK